MMSIKQKILISLVFSLFATLEFNSFAQEKVVPAENKIISEFVGVDFGLPMSIAKPRLIEYLGEPAEVEEDGLTLWYYDVKFCNYLFDSLALEFSDKDGHRFESAVFYIFCENRQTAEKILDEAMQYIEKEFPLKESDINDDIFRFHESGISSLYPNKPGLTIHIDLMASEETPFLIMVRMGNT